MLTLPSFFIIDPPLKLGIMEKYFARTPHFIRQKWRQLWKVGGDATRPEGCHIHAWNSLVKYWNAPLAKHESGGCERFVRW
jgi:hypothetical protein